MRRSDFVSLGVGVVVGVLSAISIPRASDFLNAPVCREQRYRAFELVAHTVSYSLRGNVQGDLKRECNRDDEWRLGVTLTAQIPDSVKDSEIANYADHGVEASEHNRVVVRVDRLKSHPNLIAINVYGF